MALNHFQCTICGEVFRSFKPVCNHCGKPANKLLAVPNGKFLAPRNDTEKSRGKSQLKDQNKIIKARSRNFKRDHELDDLIQLNDEASVERYRWLNDNGVKRKKIDDI